MTELKICARADCGKVVPKPPGFGKARYASRKFCSHDCSNANKVIAGSKVCARCGEIFHRKPNDSRWNERRYCSQKCSRAVVLPLADPADRKTCEGCGEEFGPTQGTLLNSWKIQRFHSSECALRQRETMARARGREEILGANTVSPTSSIWPAGYRYEDDPRLIGGRRDFFTGRPTW